ncbi:MAG: hypothetical protein FWC80_04830 [Firmicutes bacterium]|nr:hypothetical protein [Bacillota bacterium]
MSNIGWIVIARSQSDEAIPSKVFYSWDCGACPELAEWVANTPRNDIYRQVFIRIVDTKSALFTFYLLLLT